MRECHEGLDGDGRSKVAGAPSCEDADGSYTERLTSSAAQYGSSEFKELFTALAKLPVVQREVLLLVGVSGFSYDEAAAICCTPVGTVKSRVNRARTMLAKLLGIDREDRFDRRGDDESDHGPFS
jgi:RNA polymerase sigma-70 factor (ECF subfamily)